jgi:hypothetical protein
MPQRDLAVLDSGYTMVYSPALAKGALQSARSEVKAEEAPKAMGKKAPAREPLLESSKSPAAGAPRPPAPLSTLPRRPDLPSPSSRPLCLELPVSNLLLGS